MIVIIFGLLMSLSHFFSENILKIFSKYESHLISFSAGISITYIFLNLFPEFSQGISKGDEFIFMSILIGFVVFHLIEKYIYKNTSNDKKLEELAIEDSVISFIYHFIIGMIMVTFFNKELYEGILFFIPATFYTGMNTIPVDMTKSKIVKVVLSISTLLGVLFAQFIFQELSRITYLTLLGFIIGALSFTVTRHSIPFGKKGKPLFFIIGVILYSLIIILVKF